MDTSLSALIKPVVDALIAALKAARGKQLKRSAARDLSAAVRELLTANPNENFAEAKIAAAKAAGLLSEDLFLAEKLLKASKAEKRRPPSQKKSSKAGARHTPVRKGALRKPARAAPAKPAQKRRKASKPLAG
jgi:hypothetical protein